MPMTRAARGFCAVARIAWPMREVFMKKTTPAASDAASTTPISLAIGTSTKPSKKYSVSYSSLMLCVSDPNSRLRICAIMIATPKVASSEVNRSRSITRRITSL